MPWETVTDRTFSLWSFKRPIEESTVPPPDGRYCSEPSVRKNDGQLCSNSSRNFNRGRFHYSLIPESIINIWNDGDVVVNHGWTAILKVVENWRHRP